MQRIKRALIVSVVATAMVLLIGDWRDVFLWIYLAVFITVVSVTLLTLDDDLARERFSPPEPGADRLSLRVVRVIALLHILVSLVDNRFGLSHVSAASRIIGIVGFATGFGLILYSMRTNRFFSAVVRVQEDRGHHVIDRGPYAYLRHPGYAGMIVAIPLNGLALGSWYGAAVALIYAALIFRRVRFEDGFLQQNLAGYRDYARRVRYRLVPGVW